MLNSFYQLLIEIQFLLMMRNNIQKFYIIQNFLYYIQTNDNVLTKKLTEYTDMSLPHINKLTINEKKEILFDAIEDKKQKYS